MKKKTLLILGLMIVTSILITSCQPATAEEKAEEVPEVVAETEEEKKLLVIAIAAEVGIPYFTTMQCGAMAAAEKYNVDLDWTGPAEWDFNKQLPFIDGALALEPDGMILVPTDPEALVQYVKDWMAEGLPVVTVDVTLVEPVELQGIESDHYSGGVAAADAMFELTGGEGSYLPVGSTPASFAMGERIGGFVDRMKELKPDVDIFDTCHPHHDSTKAAECTSAAIIGETDLKGVYVGASAAASGASSAIIEHGVTDEVVLIAYDADPQQIQDLKAGVYGALIAQDPWQMGYNAVKLIAMYVRGEIAKEDIPQNITVPMAALTLENVGNPELQKFHYVGDISLCPPAPEEE